MKGKLILLAISLLLCIIFRDWRIICLILTLCIIGILVLDLIVESRRRKQIDELIEYITKVQDYTSLPEIQEITEDRFGILQSEIYKVVTLLREEYSSEHKQKTYMSEMMSDISHQFKTPLTSIQLMTELLMQPEVTDEQRLEYTAKIETQIGRITWLIRSLLTLSQLEAGVLELKSEPVDLANMMKQVAESVEIMAEVADVQLIMNIPSDIVIYGDSHWLREAFGNLVKNAVEHTGSGGYVKVSALQNNLSTTINVEDNGKGIEKQHLPHIFERFYKAGNESGNSVGIGLAIAKQIVNNHGGTIAVDSKVGKGTRFVIKLYS